MFDLDTWQEIFATLWANRLRAALTAFCQFFGIFLMIFMLGNGSAFENGVNQNMMGFATNAVYVWGRTTTMPYEGMQPGRRISYDNRDTTALAERLPGIEHLAPRNQLGGFRGGNTVSRGNRTGAFSVHGDYPQFIHVQPMIISSGRFLNHLDIDQSRKVAVIGEAVEEALFESGEEPIGQSIKINGVYFQVVGTFRSRQKGDAADRQTQAVYVPFTTFQRAFNFGDRVGWFAITARTGVDAEELEKQVRALLASRHKVSPDDQQALGSFNAKQRFDRMRNLFMGIRLLIWFVGVVTLLVGVVAVANIMLIVVKERTREIGIRKAMGATPWSIVSTFVQESILLTSMAGYLGIVAGVAVLELVDKSGIESEFFVNPSVDLTTALVATGVLVVAGTVAGLVPAWMAAKVDPVEALRAE